MVDEAMEEWKNGILGVELLEDGIRYKTYLKAKTHCSTIKILQFTLSILHFPIINSEPNK
jgi:hypothetical protein